MNKELIRIDYFRGAAGKSPFKEWYESLTDSLTQTIVDARLTRIRLGNFGDCKPVGQAVYELRITHGPGYRIYFGKESTRAIILVCGGNKGSQRSDIKKAQELWKNWRQKNERQTERS